MSTFIQILLAIAGTVTFADLLRLIFIPQDKKSKDVANKDAEIAALKHTIEILREQSDRDAATIQRKDDEIAKLSKDKADLMAAQSCLFDDMCVHKGCRIRKPHQGQGSLWYQKYREDPSLGADYDSIDTLLKKDRLKRLAAEKVVSESSEEIKNQ